MRAFVAIEIPETGVIDAIVGFQGELKETLADIKLVERQNLHLTVRFLGEITQAQAEQTKQLLRSLELPRTDVELAGAGAFPNVARPNVVWVGIDQHAAGVTTIANDVIQSLKGMGQTDDRPFSPHLTVARVRSSRGADKLEACIGLNSSRRFGRSSLLSIKLKSSVLTPSGPVYSDEGEFPLK